MGNFPAGLAITAAGLEISPTGENNLAALKDRAEGKNELLHVGFEEGFVS